MMRFAVISFLLFTQSVHASAGDTTRMLSKDEVISIVKEYHPVIKQADLRVKQARAKVLGARGAFDPKLTAGYDRKTFDGETYYSYFNPELKIPTWYGIEFKAGLEEVAGTRPLSELTLGKTSYIGVKVSALEGLLLDERRAALKQSRAMQQMSIAEQQLIVNDILFEAVTSYWKWVQQYRMYRIYADVVKNNEERLAFVRLEYEQGNRPAIDTVEVTTQLQLYQLLEQEAYMEFVNAGYKLSGHLWLENNMPFEWQGNITPDSFFPDSDYSLDEVPGVESLVTQSLYNHPKLQTVDYKIEYLEVDRMRKGQAILPRLDISANLLSKGYKLPPELSTPFLENNHKIGADFSLPLFLRKERGAYRLSKFKVAEMHLERDYTSLQIENKIRSYYNEVMVLRNQVELYEEAYQNYARMFRGEQTRYNVGEGTLFLINSRETKLLEARRKLIELKTKWQMSYAGLLWSAAMM